MIDNSLFLLLCCPMISTDIWRPHVGAGDTRDEKDVIFTWRMEIRGILDRSMQLVCVVLKD